MKTKEKALVGAGYGILLAGLVGSLCWTNARLDKSQAELEALRNQQETQIEAVYDRVDEVEAAAGEKAEELEGSIEATKGIVHNTNKALVRLSRKKSDVLEAPRIDLEEPVEEFINSTPLSGFSAPIATSEGQESEPVEYASEEPGGMTPLGNYQLTAYEWTGSPCANGNYPTEGYTVACNSLPLGTKIYIEGYGTYTVEDRGGMGSNVIDIYLGDAGECVQFGRQNAQVYIVE